MNLSFWITFFITLLGGILIYAERQQSEKWKKFKHYLPYGIPILGIVLLVTNTIGEKNKEENKPVPYIEINNLPENKATVLIRIMNYGNEPINNVSYVIQDSYKLPKDPKNDIIDKIVFDKYYHLSEFGEKINSDMYLSKNSETIGTSTAKTIYSGKIDNCKQMVFYNLTVIWDKGSYQFFYWVKYDEKLNEYNLYTSGVELNDSTNVYPTEYFKNVPKKHWKNLPFLSIAPAGNS
jgi:hypothetical protein